MKHTLQTLAGLVILWCLLGARFAAAQVSPGTGFDDVNDVIFLDVAGETVALVSTFSPATTLELSGQSTTTNPNLLPLGGYLSNSIQGNPIQQVYFFSTGYENFGSGSLEIFQTTNQNDLYFGELQPQNEVAGFAASQEDYLNQIDLTWSAVSGAEGYMIFREDLGVVWPMANLLGDQQTMYTDHGLEPDHAYTYYILAYNLQDNLFLSTPVAVTGTTKPFEFAATSDNEARVTFTYEFDNHLLVGLENQAAYIEVLDVTNGLQKLVYGDELTLTDISEEALLFDNSLVMQGNQHDGVYAKAGLGELNAWTAEMWVNPENMGKHHVLLDGGNILVSLLNSGQYFLNVNGQHYHSQANPITWNDWNHVSITYTGSALRVFHNGEVIPMSPSSALDFQEVNTIANAGLTSQTEFGRLWNFNSNSSLINYHGAFGMIRMWAKARTPDQVAADYKDIYDRAADGLLAQWTFDQETISLPDDIFGQTLTIGTTDDAQFPIRWKPSFAFVDPEVNKSVSVWLDQPLATGTERDYQISIYETGTGRLISRKTDSHLFTHPGAPEVVATPHTRSPYAFQLAISPKSVWADKYILRRHQGSESVILGSVTPEKTGDTYALDALSFTDDFVYQSSTSIVGGGTYTWSATPVYSDLERSFQDEDHQGQSNAHTALDYLSGVQVTAMGNAISLGWNATHLINAGYDTVRIERDGEILVLMPSSEASYTDTLMLFGQDYTYSVLPMKNGQVALAQSGVVGLAPNGAVSGMLVSKKGQYVLPNHPVILQNTTVDLTVDTVTTDAFGALAYSGIVYGVEAGFVWKSLTNEVLKEDTFTLTRLAPQAETPFVLYDLDLDVEKDASVITDLQVAADAVANGLQFTWTSTPSHAGAGQPLFTNVYRDDELIDILVDATRYVDYSATQGEHSYRFKSYYYDDTRTFVYQGKEEVMNVVPPALAVASQFAVATTDDKVVEITWEYPTDAVVSSFVLTRTNEATDVTHVVATLPHQTAGDNYTVVDALGYPGQAYTYILTAHSLATEAHELASQSQGYPMIGVGDVVFSAAATAGSVGAYLDANVSTTKLAWTSWDGLMLLDEEATPLDKAAHGTQTAGITPYVLFQPQVSAANGNLTLAVYKHTDEGLFVSASEDYDYSNAEVASGFILPVPNAPTLATGSPDLQVPVLTASKDGRGRIFVAWEYPHYTEVEFHLAWKTAENSNWNTTVLPNEQRAWLHEHPASQVMEYKLYAQYQDGRRSDEAWDYGIAKTYRQLEGYVYDANNAPQPHAWVGILGAWTQTDSAGYYRLADLELPDQNPTLQYVAPGTHTVSELPLAVTNTPQRIVQHIHTDVTNNLMPAGGEFASVFALADATNITHLTNEVRWTMDGDKFSGVKVYLGSGTNEVADIRQGNPMVYIDSLDDNNAGGAIYWVRPYFTNAMGQKVFLDAGSKTNQGLDYPPLEAPAYASAFTNQALGTVELSWTHRRNNVDGYLIARNDEEIGRVPAGSPHHFVDSTGLPTMVYRYDIYAYVDRSSQTISSQLPITVDALYPAPGNPVAPTANLALVAGTQLEDNAVKVSWTYPEEVLHDGAVLYRGLDSVASVTYPNTWIIDSLGLPETYTTYTVKTFDIKEDAWYTSAGDTANIVFPALQVPELSLNALNYDTLWVNWSYLPSGVDALELLIINTQTTDTVVHEEVPHTQTQYAYLFDQGLGGRPYRIQLRAVAYRNGQTYRSDFATEHHTYQALPTPVAEIAYTAESQEATLSWDYSTERNDGFLLTIKKGGSVYTGPSPLDGSAIGYENLPLAPLQRQYTLVPGFEDLISGGDTFTFELTAHQNAQGGLPVSVSLDQVMVISSPALYPTALEATNDGTQSVHLSWSHPANVDLLKHYVLYRDGQKVTNIDPSATSFEDVNVAPGVSHMYHLAALQAEEEYARTARGSIVGKGLITAQILTGQGTGVLGDSLLLQASVNGITYQDTAYANAEGKVYFRNLAYDTEGITYTISPAGNVQHYDRASSLVTLDESLSQSFADAFINQQTRTIAGTVTNLYCQTGCGRDSLELILFSINEAGERRMVTDTKTDHLGRFSFAIPYYLSGFTAYEVEIPNQALNGEGQPMDPYGYYYQAGENMQVNPEDSTLVITFPVEHLITKKAHQVAVYEQSHHPLTVEIAGPGDCDVFTGYEFVVRIRDRGGKLDLRLDTENRRISQTLPPYDFEITVLDVNKPDAFSAAVLDYFRSRPLHVNNRGHYTRFLDSEVEEPENPVRHMRYNERTNLSISGTETVLDNKCGTYVMAEDQEITVTVTPEQIINGKPCSATSGYILAKFKGGEVTDLDNDTLEYVNGAWESLLVKATTPNLVAPYTQLLELYYYDANGNYQGFATEEILVTGQQQNPGADIFVINDNPYPVLLNVLRDPPGDKSYASIEEKSSYQIQLERTKKSSWEYGLEREHTNTAAGYTLISKINSSHGVDNSRTSSLNYSVEFTEGLSTLKNAQLSENLESYLDGPDADVLVGVNLILAYGMTEVLEYNSCVPTKTRNLGVNPAGISTMWAYTRSQIENTVRYYEDVTTPGSGYVVESTDTNVASSQQIIQDIANSRENFQRILEVADTQFTPICEMCTYVANNSTNSTSRRIDRFDDIDEVLGYRNEISNFCTTYAGYNKEKQECSSAPIQEILTSWDDATRNLYDVIYRKYLTLHELERFHHSNSERELDFSQWEETVEKISFFEPIENITFGGGSKVSRSYGSSSSETDKYSHDHILSLSLKLGGKMHLTFDVQAWFGFGGGTYVENVKEADATTAIHGHVKTKQTWSYAINQTTGQSFKTKFSLDDKDDGDHYSVDVLQSGVYANTRMTPFFNVVGGRSSCPYVPGTISRDQPTLQLLDEQGNQMPTKYFDLDPEVPFALPISVSSGNPFGENRLIMVAAPLGSNRNGLNTEIEGIRVNSYRGATVWVEADTSYQTTLYLNKRDLPAYDFEDIQIIAKPACMGNKFTYFEEAHVIDTLELEFHFRKPISPITLESDLGDWFVIDDVDPNATESVTFKLRDYDVEQNQHSLKEIVIEYKRVNDEVWTRITDATQQTETLSVEVLLAYYQEMLNTYSEPTYPFVWQLPHDLVDGQYQVRAMVVHENGSIAYSNILTGTVDRTAPRIVGTTSPADSLLSQGDEIAISFDEALDCETFLNGTNVSVKVLADDVHAEVELFKTVDFSYTCSGSGIVITINPAKLQAYDGRRWEVQVRSITDWLGNASDPIAPTWQFQVDYFKQSPSSVTLVGPEDWRINAATAEQTLHFAITDYDVFQASTSLSEIALQYKRDVDADWLTASTLTVAQLEARHRAQGVADEIPIDTLNWDASTVLDGSYTVRAVATGNTGRQSVSGTASGLIDRVAPALLGTPSPQDGVYDSQDDVAFTFTEAIDCEAGYQFNSSVLDYGATSAEELEPTQVVCLGDQVQFIFAEELLKDHFGGTVTIELALVTDLAGNGIEGTGTVTYSFIIGQLGEETSPVALLTPSADWQVNQAQPEVTFTLGGYDLYELHSTLDSLVLEYSAEHESEWHAIESMTQEALANHHVANRATESEEPTYAVTWMPGVADGNYEVRAVAYGAHGFPEYSGAIQGRIDQTSPWLLSMTPENGALQHSQTIALTFTEAIAEASLAGDALSLQEQVLVTPFGGGEPYFSYVKIPEEMYRVAYQGETVAFYFDDQFTVTYDGATLALGVDGITDQNGNVLEDAVTATFAVQNVTPTAQRLESLHLTGEQLEDGSIALTWNAYDALGTEGYTVERSANGQFFETVATLQEALGYQEAVRFEEVIFYRLRLQRNDGTEKYSRVAVIEDQGIALPLAVEVFPNPIEENILRFSWYSKGSEESVTLEVRDVRGVLVHKEELDLTTRGTQISVQLPEHLDPGMYLLNATQGVQSHSMKFFNP